MGYGGRRLVQRRSGVRRWRRQWQPRPGSATACTDAGQGTAGGTVVRGQQAAGSERAAPGDVVGDCVWETAGDVGRRQVWLWACVEGVVFRREGGAWWLLRWRRVGGGGTAAPAGGAQHGIAAGEQEAAPAGPAAVPFLPPSLPAAAARRQCFRVVHRVRRQGVLCGAAGQHGSGGAGVVFRWVASPGGGTTAGHQPPWWTLRWFAGQCVC